MRLQISALLTEADVNLLQQGKTINKIRKYKTFKFCIADVFEKSYYCAYCLKTINITVRFLKYICYACAK